MIKYKKFTTREYIRMNRDMLFIFGDNDIRAGYGGQAKEMRGEPNAFGIRVKKYPVLLDDAYYSDNDFCNNIIKIETDIVRIKQAQERKNYKHIVFPIDGVGTGRAKLEEKAPKTWGYLCGALRMKLNIDNISSKWYV